MGKQKNFSWAHVKTFSKGRRVNAKKVVSLVTDGHSNVDQHLTVPQADALKKSGVEIHVVAAGGTIDSLDEMVKVASDPKEKFLYRVKSYAGFLRIVELALEQDAPGKYAVKRLQLFDFARWFFN